jgi:hypothetical protein
MAGIDDRPTGQADVATIGRAMTPVVNVEHSPTRPSDATTARTTETSSRATAPRQDKAGTGRRAAAVPEFLKAQDRTDFPAGLGAGHAAENRLKAEFYVHSEIGRRQHQASPA